MTRPRPAIRLLLPLMLTAAILAPLLAGCAPSSRPRPSSAALAACRQSVDRVYSAQNRVELSTRDQRDTPLSGSYLSGVTSRGLGSEYGRENQIASCLANSASPAPAATPAASTGSGSGAGIGTGTGTPFTPAAR